ncbi:MAG TPA: ACP S-malonyltransferase [Sedimentisphaerales bacterium]|jgi:[acyl-carrier-protein] S-malonyltransferase|nr:ACP S-malonyltransferase [Sedimentisphaerales bacterium]HNU29673.1 ACP S-malonyltransferase [Sedimentisphaerales bacterium]
MKTAFLFPGQGAQTVGMGTDVAQAFPVAAALFDKANEILGFDLRTVCFQGPADQLNSTTMSQPAIFVTSAALLEVLRTSPKTANLKPDVTAGLSMGEYTALYAAGSLSFEDGLRLVRKRGEAMQAAADATKGTMVSLIGLDEDKVRQLCDEARQDEVLEPVNFNCPGQIVVSGSLGACSRAEQLGEKYGAAKAVRLDVAGGFHTSLMSGAAQALRQALVQAGISQPAEAKTIANITAEYYRTPQEVVDGLTRQLTAAILWHKCMERLLAEGVEEFYEIGPGRVLTGLMKRINRKTKVTNISDLASLKAVVGE